jgi:hypothetical protein
MIFIDIYTSCRALTKIETLENQIRISELLTLEKVQREFVRHRSFYFAEVVYDNNGKFYDKTPLRRGLLPPTALFKQNSLDHLSIIKKHFN